MVNKSRLLESIANLVKEKRVDGISDLRDESDRDGMHIVIELKRDANPQIVLNQLYSFTQMQETVGVIMLALQDGQPKVMTLKEILEHYIEFQADIIRRRTEYDLRKAKEREHILEGLKIALDFIDEVIKILRNSKSIPEGKAELIERFGLDDIQATAIVQMRLGQLTGLERTKIEEELAALLEKIADFEDILANYGRVLSIIKTEIEQIKKKFGDDRRTEIMAVSGEVDIEDLIPVEDCVVTLTHYGYIKRQPVDVYKSQKRGGRGVSGMKQREEDFVEELFICSSHDNVLFLTDKGRMYQLKCYEIPEGSKASRGTNMVNLLQLEGDEKVTAMIQGGGFEEDKFLVMVTRNGIIKRTQLSAYKNIRKSGLIAITLQDGDKLAWVRVTTGSSELIIATKMGMAIRIEEKAIRPLSRSAMGVRAIKLREGDEVVGMARLREGATVMTVTDRGQGRRSEVSDYRVQGRGGYGSINYRVNDIKGYVCGIKVVDETDDIILISNDGVIIRMHVSDISVMSRYASGVRVMRLSDDARVVTFARAERDEEEETETIDEAELAKAEAEAKEAEATVEPEAEEEIESTDNE